MEQWQLQQRALKEKERQKKMETLELHKQFRGGVSEEELKLRAIKEAERLKKLETMEMHKQFRGGVSEEDLKLSAWRHEDRLKKQEAIENHHGYRLTAEDIEKRERKRREEQYPLPEKVEHSDPRDLIEEGAVHRLKENFNSPVSTHATSLLSPSVSPKRLADRNVDDIAAPPLDDFDAIEGTAKTNVEGLVSIDTNVETSSFEPAFTDPSPTSKAAMYFDADIAALKGDVRSIQADQETGQATSVSAQTAPGSRTDDETKRVDKHENLQLQSSETIGFSFGIITISDKPDLSGYMKAVDEELRVLLHNRPNVVKNIVYDQKCFPYVKDVTLDGK